LTVRVDTIAGTELAGYRIETLLGRGGMSVVYRAEDLRLRRKVALKLLAPELAAHERFRERFLRESELAAAIDHPNIVPVFQAGEVGGHLYIAMRHVEGTDLKRLLRRDGPLAPERALALVGQVADALDAAHARGLVHRDVKPSNVLVSRHAEREHAYLADFGVTKLAADGAGNAEPGQLVGTIDYVAPEQIRGDPVDARADVYSLGCLLYECLVGSLPFARAGEVAAIYAHLAEEPPAPSGLRPELPPELDAVVAKAMAKQPDERWSSAGELVGAARVALGGQTASPTRRRRVLVGLAAGAVALGAGAAGLLLPGSGTPVVRADALVRIGSGSKITGGVELGPQPTAVTTCAGSVWVTSASGLVSQIDPRNLHIHRVRVPGRPTDVADVGSVAAVVSTAAEGAATLIDGQFGRVSGSVRLAGSAAGLRAVAFGRDVWVANPDLHALQRLDPPYTAVAATVPLGADRPTGIAAGERALWAIAGRSLWRVDPGSGRTTRFRLGFAPRAVAAGGGAVWLVNRGAGAVARFAPRDGRVVALIPVGRGPVSVAAGVGSVWVANGLDRTVSRIDPLQNRVTRTISVDSPPVDIAVGLGEVWVVKRPA
jgi:streptogramin lyase